MSLTKAYGAVCGFLGGGNAPATIAQIAANCGIISHEESEDQSSDFPGRDGPLM